jgi:hypothetical protein
VRLAACLALVCAGSASAWPVDWAHEVPVGREKAVPLQGVDFFQVEDPQLLQLEWRPADGELVLKGLKAGRTTVLLGAQGQVAVWRVRVGGRPALEDAALTDAQRACPQVKVSPQDDVKLTVSVSTEACRQALERLFETDAFVARELEVTFDGRALQAQLGRIQEGLKGLTASPVLARYVGAGLVLEGTVSRAEHLKVLWVAFRRSVGSLALDDRLEESADAGVR